MLVCAQSDVGAQARLCIKGVNKVFQINLGSQGRLQRLWIMPNKLYGTILCPFFQFVF